jgi:glycosyltransferase involved in cell wall biosynthesis
LNLAVYMDYRYRRAGDATYAEVPFALFLAGLAPWFDRFLMLGRLHPGPGTLPHRLPDGIEVGGLPHYEAASDPLRLALALPVTLRRFWRFAGEVDMVLVFGPHPLAVLLVAVALLRRRRVAIGVRQHYPDYIRHRHPGNAVFRLIGRCLEAAWQLYARLLPTLAVGPDLAESFRGSRELLEIAVSLVGEGEPVAPERALEREYGGELRVLSVGRLDPEKNPLLLAEVAARLGADRRWRLIVCGDGALAPQLAERVESLGVAERVELRGYVPVDGELPRLYRQCHMLLHVSLTEGFPQVLYEAFAAGLPAVATEVGGVGRGESREALYLVPPGDAPAAAAGLEALAADPALRERLVRRGCELVSRHTTERECRRVAAFLGSPRAEAASP